MKGLAWIFCLALLAYGGPEDRTADDPPPPVMQQQTAEEPGDGRPRDPDGCHGAGGCWWHGWCYWLGETCGPSRGGREVCAVVGTEQQYRWCVDA